MASKFRVDNSLFERDSEAERAFGIDDIRIYAYKEDDEYITILCEVVCKTTPTKTFTLNCSTYDLDGDVLGSEECASYGNGVVTSSISPENFFNRFPFKFWLSDVDLDKISKIRIAPENER